MTNGRTLTQTHPSPPPSHVSFEAQALGGGLNIFFFGAERPTKKQYPEVVRSVAMSPLEEWPN